MTSKCCSVCGAPGAKRFEDGFLCDKCKNMLPDIIKKYKQRYSLYDISMILAYESQGFIKSYSKTASLGTLSIDEAHGLLALDSDSLSKRKRPLILSVLDIENISLYPTNIKAVSHNVRCDAEIVLTACRPELTIRRTVKRNITCDYKRVDGHHVEWFEHASISFMRNIINQTYKTEAEKYDERYSRRSQKYNDDVLNAKALYMLDEVFTERELKERRNALSKVFHPDVGYVQGGECMRKITEAYNTLLPLCRKEII